MKNLKKGLAVAMSLAMIATVMPTMKVDAAITVCTTADKQYAAEVEDVYNQLVAAIEKAGKDLETVSYKTEIEYAAEDTITTVEEFLDAEVGIVNGATTPNKIAVKAHLAAATCSAKKDEMAKLGDLKKGITDAENAIITLVTHLGAKDDYIDFTTTIGQVANEYTGQIANNALKDNGKYNGGITSRELVKSAKAEYKALTENKYVTNVNDELAAMYATAISQLEALLDDAGVDFYEEGLEEYVTALNALTIDGKSVKDLVAGDATIDHTKYKALNTLLANIKADKETTLKAIEKYEVLEDAIEVEEIITTLEEMAELAEEADDLLKSSNVIIRDYKKAVSALPSKDAWHLTVEEGKEGIYDDLQDIASDKLEDILAYHTEVVSQFYDVVKTERANGKYSVKLETTELGAFLTPAEATAYTGIIGTLQSLYTKTVEDKEEATYFDFFKDYVEGIENDIKAITTGVKGITVKNLNSANAAKVVAAKDAIDRLEDGYYKKNLTASQKKAVATASKNIDILYTYMLFNGIVAETNNGWVDLGNGNWDYYKDGKAVTAWVAAGKLWYFVKDGHMLRNSWVAQDATGNVWYYVNGKGEMVVNTTIDGYAINANGEWHK